MTQLFNNEQYETLARDIISDAFYSDMTFRGRISKERQYAELVIRKLLDIDPAETVTVGKKAVVAKINALPDSAFIMNALSVLQPFGNDTTHTQFLGEVTEQDFMKVTDSLFDLIASLLINYFSKYKFGSKPEILRSFSLLPPIIRRKVLEYLYSKDSTNVSVTDKLALAILKSDGKDAALRWLEDNKNVLLAQKAVDMDCYKLVRKERGEESADFLLDNAPSMYTSCLRKIEIVGEHIAAEGALYLDFESAKPYYEQHGILYGYDNEIKEFNDIMEFLYLGRKGNDIEPSEQVVILNYLR